MLEDVASGEDRIGAATIGPERTLTVRASFTDRRMTRYQPLLLPAQAADGRWTTDEWGPLDGRVVNLGLRWRFGGEDTDADRDIKR
jgi:outer membrane receptor for ferrienterochelin and colicins